MGLRAAFMAFCPAATLLGTLDGSMVGGAGTSYGYLTIGGHYEGPFTLMPKRPKLEFTFNFVLVQ